MQSSKVSRRGFIKGAGVLGAASILPIANAAAQTKQGTDPKGRAKNLIFFVADGMGIGTLSLGHHWKRINENRPSNWIQLYSHPGIVRALQETSSASSPVTDSAAASSSWGSGHRVNNQSINTSAEGKALTPLYTYARKAGKATGLVTTCRVTHATPAGFAANVPHRDSEDTIADQYFEREIDIILGGGKKHFARKDVDLISKFRESGYQIAENLSGLERCSGASRLLGLFSNDHIPYAIDRENDPSLSGTPGLKELFQAALKSMSKRSEGFLLQVEAGRVDHAGHANDPAAILREQLEYDNCIPLAIEYIEKNPDTLLIMTTDHGTGGCQLNGWGSGYIDSGPALERINQFKQSFVAIANELKKQSDLSKSIVEKLTGLPVTDEEYSTILHAFEKKSGDLNRKLIDALRGQLLRTTAIGWTSNNHTSECVELLALGPGSEAIPPFVKNYELFDVMMNALSIR